MNIDENGPLSDLSHDSQPNYLFLAGIGRSGTSIVRRSLGLHPDIYYNGHENNIVQDVISVAQKNCTMKSRAFSMVVGQNEYDRSFRFLLESLIWPDLELRKRKIHMAAINPSLENMDYLVQVFPNSKVIGLVRNGIEVVCSRTKYSAFSNAEFTSHCDVWLRSAGIVDWGTRNDEQFRLFRHEWTYDEALTSELVKLFEWLEINPCDTVAENINSVITHPTSDTGKDFQAMSLTEKKSYFREKSQGWRQWTPENQDIFRQRCTCFMQQLGYPIPF